MTMPRVTPIVAVLAVIVALYLPGLLQPGIPHPPLPKLNDGTLQFFPWRAYWRDEVLAGRLPLWNPYLFGGTPFAGESLSAGFYPGTLLFLLPLPLELAFKLHLVLHLLVAAVFMDCLCRSLGASRMGAAFGALAFALNAQFAAFVFGGWLNPLAVASWSPAVLWAFVEAMQSTERERCWRYSAAGACFVALQLLGGHPEWAYYTTLLLGVTAAAAGWAGRKTSRHSPWRAGAVMIGIFVGGALVAGVQLLPTLEATWWSSRGQNALAGLSLSARASLSPWLLPTLLVPRLYGPWDLELSVDSWLHRALGLRVSWGETIAYVGVVPLVLSAFGWRARPRLLPPSTWLVIGALGLLFAMDDLTHLKSLTDRILPLQGVFRSPARYVFFVYFALSVLASFGMTRLEADAVRVGRSMRRVLLGATTLLAVAALTLLSASHAVASWELARFPLPQSLGALLTERPLSVEAVASWAVRYTGVELLKASTWFAVATWGVAMAGTRRGRTPRFVWILFTVTAADLGTVAWPFLRSLASPERVYAVDLDHLRPLAGTTTRIVVDGDRLLAGGRNVPLLARVRSFDGYDVFLLAHYGRVAATLGGPDQDRRLGALAVSMRLARDLTPGAGRGRWRLEPISPSVPYAYWTDRGIVVTNDDDALARLPSILDTHPPAVLVTAGDLRGPAPPAALEPAPPARVELRRDEPGRIVVRVSSARRGWLILNECWYPGWRATVDGTTTPIHRVNVAVQGIEVPAGTHVVEFHYAPASFRTGVVASVGGCVLVLSAFVRRRRTASTV